MSQTILVIEYEPRTVTRITEALAPLHHQVVTAKDVDTAVNACAKVEPRLVLITGVLPRLKVEDAIMQLRARAGLKTTPFIILMSGYTGSDSSADAAALGAQEILAKPFSPAELVARVKALLEPAKAQTVISADTRAEMLESLRGPRSTAKAVTSEELFGDLLDQEEEGSAQTQRISVQAIKTPPVGPKRADAPAAPTQPAEPAGAGRHAAAPGSADQVVEASLADVLGHAGKAARPREDTGGASVDELLSKTLSGLDVGEKRRAAPPQPAASQPRPVEPPRPTPPPPPRPPAPTTAAEVESALLGTPSGPARGKGKPFGQYELIEMVATGGMAELYKARMQGVEGFQKIVAIKRILPHLTSNDEFVTMFVDEAKLAAQLQHPNIIHIYDLGKIERSYYIAMEYIDGKDLRSILRMLEEKGRRLPLGIALYIGARLADALDYAHRKKDLQGKAMALVHRDVSPQNVLISYDGDIKLCDFGIAKAASKASHTRAGALKGKLQYMSPEQAWGKDLDGRSDIFSLGLVLYEMITGQKAFAGDSELSILEQVRSPQLTLPRAIEPGLPADVETVLMKALRENRDERFQTAGELSKALEALLQQIRPAPGNTDLGAFLSELVGRERSAAPMAAPATAPRHEAKRPEKPRPVSEPSPAQPTPAAAAMASVTAADTTAEGAVERRRSPVLVVGVITAVIVVAVLAVLLSRRGGGGGAVATAPTAAPELQEMVQQEVARQSGEAPVAAETEAAPARVRPTSPPAARPTAIAPTPAPAGAVVPPGLPTPAPTVAATTPIAQPTEVSAPVPTEAPAPTPVAAAVQAVATRPPAAAPPAVREGDLVAPGPDVIPPEPILTPKPEYPLAAARQRLGGTVILQVLVDENGAVQEVKVLRGVRGDIDTAAREAALKWRFRPATTNGVRVKFWQSITIPFRP